MPSTVAPIEQKLFDLALMMREQLKSILVGVDERLSPVQVMILRVLTEHGAMTQKDIGFVLSRDKSQIAKLIHDLAAKELVIRTPHKEDRRSVIISAVPVVQKTVDRIAKREKKIAALMLKGLTDADLENLDRLLESMTDNLLSVDKERD